MIIKLDGIKSIRSITDIHEDVLKLLDSLEEHNLIDEFENAIKDIYPEGIDYDVLHDLMRYDDYEVWKMVGIPVNDDLEPIFNHDEE